VARPPSEWFAPSIDGYMLPEDPYITFTAGRQAHVPLLAGWNEDEGRAGVVLAKNKVTAASFTAQAKERYKDAADAYLKVYPASSDEEAVESAAGLRRRHVHRLRHVEVDRRARADGAVAGVPLSLGA
jgi:para-nitrobenzyl esterase